MSASYHKVSPRIWHERWDDDTRYVAFYLLTCKHRNTEGIYHLPVEYALADLKWPMKRFKAAFHELQRDGFVFYDQDTSVCLIAKALKMFGRANPNQVKHVAGTLRELPPTPLLNRFLRVAETLCPTLSKGLQEAFPEGFPDSLDKGSERVPQTLSHPPTPTPVNTSNVGSTSERNGAADVEPVERVA